MRCSCLAAAAVVPGETRGSDVSGVRVVKEARPAVVRSYIMGSGEEALEALSGTQRQQRRAEGLLDAGGTRHGSIIYSGCAGGSLAYLTRLTLPSSRPIDYQYAGLHARPPTPVLRPPSGQGGLKRSLGRRGVSATRICNVTHCKLHSRASSIISVQGRRSVCAAHPWSQS
jgi:hypothetical protein